MEQVTIEGIYEDGKIELSEIPSGFENGDAVIVYVRRKIDPPSAKEPQYMYFGMIPTLGDLTEEDFKSAEFHGDPDDGLDWSGC